MKKILIIIFSVLVSACSTQPLRGTGDLGVIIEREIGRIQIVEHSHNTSLAKIDPATASAARFHRMAH